MPRNFTEDDFEILEEGDHPVELMSITDKQTSTGKTRWQFEFETLDALKEDEWPFKIFAWAWPNPAGLTSAFDPDGLWLASLFGDNPKQFDVDSLIGDQFVATVVHNEYNGKTYANIVRLVPYSAKKPVPTPEPALAGVGAEAVQEDFGDPFADE